eukprot:RCo047118
MAPGVHQRALLRHLLARLKVLRNACGLENGSTPTGPGGGPAGDEYSTLVSSIHCQVEEIKKDCRTLYRVRSTTSSMLTGDGSATDVVAMSHEIRRKKVILKEDLDRLAAMNRDLLMRTEKKKEKSKKGRGKHAAEVERNELLLRERESMYSTLADTYEKLEFLSNKVLEQASDRDEARMREAAHVGPGRKLKLMEGNIKPDGTFERPTGGQEPPMDPATRALFDEVDKKNVQINQGLDQISKVVRTLKQQAQAMGDEITKQNIILEGMEERLELVGDRMTGLTVKIGKFSKKVKHSNVILDVVCCVILIALIGYIVYLFKPTLFPGS